MPTLHEELDEKLDALIEDQTRLGRSRLPPERELSARWGVSRVTIAKVIQDRVSRGILERRQGSGTYILRLRDTRKTLCLGVLLRRRYAANDPHFHHLIDGIAQHADLQDCELQIFDGVEDQFARDRERNRLCRAIDAGLVDGLLVASRMSVETVQALRKRLPLVMVNHPGGPDGPPAVIPDWSAIGFLAAARLLDRGHRRIGYVTRDVSEDFSAFEQSGYRLAFRARGLPEPDPGLVLQTHRTGTDYDAERVSRYLKNERPTAVYIHDDRLAAVLIATAAEAGLAIPADLSVIGCGHFARDLPEIRRLTTIDPDWMTIGRRGVETLLALIDHEPVDSGLVTVCPTLVEGETDAPLSPGRNPP